MNPQSIKSLLNWSAHHLSHTQRPFHEARLIIAFVLEKEQSWVFAHQEHEAPPQQVTLITEYVKRRAQGEPMAKIFQRKYFWKSIFKTTQATLDPRPDTEVLVEAFLSAFPPHHPPFTLLELGVGTGCVILSVLMERPQAHGFAVDVSNEALKVAADNRRAHGLDDRLHLIQGSWLNSLRGRFDCIVSNPPYISSAHIQQLPLDVMHDPLLALCGGADGLDAYRQIASFGIKNFLAPEGCLLVECGKGQEAEVATIFQAGGCQFVKSFQDIQSIDRVLEFIARAS